MFEAVGIGLHELMAMPESQFEQTLNAILDDAAMNATPPKEEETQPDCSQDEELARKLEAEERMEMEQEWQEVNRRKNNSLEQLTPLCSSSSCSSDGDDVDELSELKGEILALMNSDDLSSEEKVEVMRCLLQASETKPTNNTEKTKDVYRELTESQVVRNDQNREWEEAIRQEQEREREEQLKKEEEKRKEIVQEREAAGKEASFQRMWRQLPAEPATGTVIGMVMPDGSRIRRTFQPDILGEWLYVWVAGMTMEKETRLYPGDFDIMQPIGGVIDRKKPLDQQGISKRSQLHVSVP